jgi:PAS domain S-box-containing protein
MRLGTRFLLLFLALSLIPLVAVFVFAYENGRRALEDSLGRLFALEAAQSIGAVDREVLTAQGTTRDWAALEWMQDVLNEDVDGRITSFLMQQARSQPLLAGARVAGAQGTVVAASHPERVGEPIAAQEAPAADSCADAPWSPGQRGPLVACSYPIRASFDDTRVVGTLLASWDLPALFRQSQQQAGRATGHGELVLLRRDGLVVHAPERWQGQLLGVSLARLGSGAASRAAAGERGYLVESIEGEEYLVGFDHSRGSSGWSALVLQDTRLAFAPIHRLRRTVLGGGTLLAVLVAALAAFVARRVTGPVLEIEAAARRVASGDLEVALVPRSSDELGSLGASFNSMVRDLREQHAQRVDKEYVDSLLAHMIDGLLVIDGQGRVERVNAGLLALVGRESSELVGQPAAALFAEGSEGLHAKVLEPARRSGAAREVEMQLVERGGAKIPVSLSAGLLPAQGAEEPSVVCIAADVRRRKGTERALVEAREAAEASARAREGFLATISHEIRTPLHGILGVVDLMAGRRLGPAPAEYADSLRRSTEALLAIVNQILDFSKLDAGKMELELREFDVRASVEAVSEILGPRAREKDLELVVRLDAGLPERVIGDAGRLRQVLLNLGGNAIAFTRRGEVVIHVSRGPQGTSLLRFAVSDTGIGIPEAARARLFQPFSQLDQSSTRALGGTGLGLAICRRLVQLMGGQIDFESEEGRGSTFRFTAELPPVPVAPADAPADLDSLRGRRVLVVDDNATNRFVAREMLSEWGAAVTEASDAWEALDLLRGRARGQPGFDLALIDYQMPEMDGGQLAGQIRKDPALVGLPLVLLTSVPLHGDAVKLMKLGLDGCLTKPVRQATLRDTIAAVLRRREAPSPAGRLSLVGAGAARGERRVLVVDPDEDTSDRAREAFERVGCRVRSTKGEQEALVACAEESPDVIVLGAALPDAPGVLRRIRSDDPSGHERPTVVIVGSDAPSPTREASEDDVYVVGTLDGSIVERVLSRPRGR